MCYALLPVVANKDEDDLRFFGTLLATFPLFCQLHKPPLKNLPQSISYLGRDAKLSNRTSCALQLIFPQIDDTCNMGRWYQILEKKIDIQY